MKTTQRGFKIFLELEDSHGQKIRVQESSSTQQACWIFAEYEDGESVRQHLGKHVSASPHLSPAQARKVALALLQFAEDAE